MGQFDALRAALLKNQINVPEYQEATPGAQMQDADAGFTGYGPPLPTDVTDPTNVLLDKVAGMSRFDPTTVNAGAAGDVGSNAARMGGTQQPQNAQQIEDDVNRRFATEQALKSPSPPTPPDPTPAPALTSTPADPNDPANKAKFAALAAMIGRHQ